MILRTKDIPGLGIIRTVAQFALRVHRAFIGRTYLFHAFMKTHQA